MNLKRIGRFLKVLLWDSFLEVILIIITAPIWFPIYWLYLCGVSIKQIWDRTK